MQPSQGLNVESTRRSGCSCPCGKITRIERIVDAGGFLKVCETRVFRTCRDAASAWLQSAPAEPRPTELKCNIPRSLLLYAGSSEYVPWSPSGSSP